MLLSLRGKKVKTGIVKTVKFSLSFSKGVHLGDFGEDSSDLTPSHVYKRYLLASVFHLLKAGMVML